MAKQVPYTITVRETDSRSDTIQRVQSSIQSRLPDFEFPFDGRSGTMRDIIQAIRSYAREAYGIEIRLAGYCPREGGHEEWVLVVCYPDLSNVVLSMTPDYAPNGVL